MTAAFTSTGIRVAQGPVAYVFDFKWNHLSNMWDLYHGNTWLAGRSQSYPNYRVVMGHGVPMETETRVYTRYSILTEDINRGESRETVQGTQGRLYSLCWCRIVQREHRRKASPLFTLRH